MTRILSISMLLLMLAVTYGYAQMGHGMMRQSGEGHMVGSSSQESSATEYKSNGETIYYTGINEHGEVIPYKSGPMWLNAHGGGCKACHGSTGKGGVAIMMGNAIPSDIRYKSLTVEEHSHGGVKDEHTRYTDKLIRRAITEGVNPAGKSLNWTMPRYQLSDKDFHDLMEFMKTLDNTHSH